MPLVLRAEFEKHIPKAMVSTSAALWNKLGSFKKHCSLGASPKVSDAGALGCHQASWLLQPVATALKAPLAVLRGLHPPAASPLSQRLWLSLPAHPLFHQVKEFTFLFN